jgi:hypothetical protein
MKSICSAGILTFAALLTLAQAGPTAPGKFEFFGGLQFPCGGDVENVR